MIGNRSPYRLRLRHHHPRRCRHHHRGDKPRKPL